MILEEETFEAFGYRPSDLKQHSGRKILAACDDCGKVRVVKKQNYCALCNSCAAKNRKGEYSPTWRGGLVKRICENCGKEFGAKPSQIKIGHGRFCSNSCAHWKGGISFEPYCEKFNDAFKEYIREKFGRVCFLCPTTEEENGQRLSVHHVNYDKDCLCNDNLTCQFVPLCRSCNSRANFNREMWEDKIKNMLRNALNGWYI